MGSAVPVMIGKELEATSGPHWWSPAESPTAWTSIRHADSWGKLLQRMASLRASRERRLLEWGADCSALWHTSCLDVLSVRCHWSAIEYELEYFEAALMRPLVARTNARSEEM